SNEQINFASVNQSGGQRGRNSRAGMGFVLRMNGKPRLPVRIELPPGAPERAVCGGQEQIEMARTGPLGSDSGAWLEMDFGMDGEPCLPTGIGFPPGAP